MKRAPSAGRPRLRDLGVAIGGFPTGRRNAITDVAGVRVGHVTQIHGAGKLQPGTGPVRTGVTAVIPASGDVFLDRVYAGSHTINGAGEIIGLSQLDEWGLLEMPILLTTTMCVGRVADASVSWLIREHPLIGQDFDVVIPVVAECDDSFLNDAQGRHVSEKDVWTALDGARGGAVAEGCVGAGTGMQTFDFAGGIGTSSRRVRLAGASYTVGFLVLTNFGRRELLRIDGVPVGRLLEANRRLSRLPRRGPAGSIIVLIATDVPSSHRQLVRLARRAALAIGRVGGYAANNSGEIVVAWSTANRVPRSGRHARHAVELLLDEARDPLYEATVDGVEEAIINAICAGVDMRGHSDHLAPAIPLADLGRAFARYRPRRAGPRR